MYYQIVEQEVRYQGFFRMDRYRIRHDTYAGEPLEVQRELLERGDAVAVLLYDADLDRVLLIEQFRIGPVARQDQAWMLEIVAGMIDEGESEQQAAQRECLEEAGYQIQSLHFLGRYYVSPGGTSERIALYLGLVNSQQAPCGGGGVAEENEDIRSIWCSRQQALAWLAEGRICSGAPMLALMLAFGWQGVRSCE